MKYLGYLLMFIGCIFTLSIRFSNVNLTEMEILLEFFPEWCGIVAIVIFGGWLTQ